MTTITDIIITLSTPEKTELIHLVLMTFILLINIWKENNILFQEQGATLMN